MTDDEQRELNETFINAARVGNLVKVKSLLERGAEIDSRTSAGGATALIIAACSGHNWVVEFLLKAGADSTLRDNSNKTALDYACEKDGRWLVKLLQEFDPDQIIFERRVSNRILEDIFDFTALEKISLIRDGKGGPVEAATCVGFAALDDAEYSPLRKAFDEHVRRGGKTDEARVFSGKLLNKPRTNRHLAVC